MAKVYFPTREQVLAITNPLDRRVRKLEGFVRTFAQLKQIINEKVAETGKTDEVKIAELKDDLVGVEIPDRWANTGGTVYEDPMIVVNIGKFKGEDEELHIGAMLMRKYACAETVVFDAAETEETTDTVADGVHFYYGLAEGKTSPTAADLTYLFDTKSEDGVRINTPWAEGTPLGGPFSKIYKNAIGDHTKNIIQYGYNNWKVSAYRQYLNSDVAKGTSWWDKDFAWDVATFGHRVGNMAPSNATTLRGYKCGCTGFDASHPEGLLKYVKPVYIKTWKNYVTDGATSGYRAEDVYETLDTFFLPSGADMYGDVNLTGTPKAGVESELSPYFKAATGLGAPGNSQNAGRIRYAETNKSVGTVVRLRSAYRGYSYNAWTSSITGSVSNSTANRAYASVPACVIY